MNAGKITEDSRKHIRLILDSNFLSKNARSIVHLFLRKLGDARENSMRYLHANYAMPWSIGVEAAGILDPQAFLAREDFPHSELSDASRKKDHFHGRSADPNIMTRQQWLEHDRAWHEAVSSPGEEMLGSRDPEHRDIFLQEFQALLQAFDFVEILPSSAFDDDVFRHLQVILTPDMKPEQAVQKIRDADQDYLESLSEKYQVHKSAGLRKEHPELFKDMADKSIAAWYQEHVAALPAEDKPHDLLIFVSDDALARSRLNYIAGITDEKGTLLRTRKQRNHCWCFTSLQFVALTGLNHGFDMREILDLIEAHSDDREAALLEIENRSSFANNVFEVVGKGWAVTVANWLENRNIGRKKLLAAEKEMRPFAEMLDSHEFRHKAVPDKNRKPLPPEEGYGKDTGWSIG